MINYYLRLHQPIKLIVFILPSYLQNLLGCKECRVLHCLCLGDRTMPLSYLTPFEEFAVQWLRLIAP